MQEIQQYQNLALPMVALLLSLAVLIYTIQKYRKSKKRAEDAKESSGFRTPGSRHRNQRPAPTTSKPEYAPPAQGTSRTSRYDSDRRYDKTKKLSKDTSDTGASKDEDDFLISAAVAAVTGSEIAGVAAGGSVTGAIVGGMFQDEPEPHSEAAWDAGEDTFFGTDSSSSSSSDSSWSDSDSDDSSDSSWSDSDSDDWGDD